MPRREGGRRHGQEGRRRGEQGAVQIPTRTSGIVQDREPLLPPGNQQPDTPDRPLLHGVESGADSRAVLPHASEGRSERPHGGREVQERALPLGGMRSDAHRQQRRGEEDGELVRWWMGGAVRCGAVRCGSMRAFAVHAM